MTWVSAQPLQPCRVGSIASDGIRYDPATNVTMTKYRTTSKTTRIATTITTLRSTPCFRFGALDAQAGAAALSVPGAFEPTFSGERSGESAGSVLPVTGSG